MYIKKQKNIKKTRYRQKPLDLKNAEGLEKHTQSVVLSIGKSAPVAQGIERRFPKPCVGGSNPLGSANLKPLESIDISVISAVFVLLAICICCKIISLKGRLRAFGVGHLRYMLNVLLIF